jgi:hypothetical protein
VILWEKGRQAKGEKIKQLLTKHVEGAVIILIIAKRVIAPIVVLEGPQP